MTKLETVAIFADCGVSAHQAQYRKAGAVSAQRGAHIVCSARRGDWPRAVVDAALAEGGTVTVMTGPISKPLNLPQGVTIEKHPSDDEAAAATVRAAQAIIGLPAGLETVGGLYAAWVKAGGAQSGRPVGLLNRDRAYEVIKGFANDIASPGRGSTDSLIQFSETIEDLWHRLTRMI